MWAKKEQSPSPERASNARDNSFVFAGYERRKMDTGFNFLNISWGKDEFAKDERLCEVCGEKMIPYMLFNCNHITCEDCLVDYIELNLKEGNLPVCLTDCCGKESDGLTVTEFLKKKDLPALLSKYADLAFRKEKAGRLFDCPDCRETFEINPNAAFVTHCQKSFCRKCGAPHAQDQKCDDARYVHALDMLECPIICPNCRELFEVRVLPRRKSRGASTWCAGTARTCSPRASASAARPCARPS